MSTPTSTPGRTIGGRYALRSAIGAGGMGTVWRGYDQVLAREVAIKEVLLPPGLPAAERTLLCERTLREARAAASLNTPSVVRIYDVVEEDDRPWIVMELVAAPSLAEIVGREGPLPPVVVADVGLQVLDALEAAHAAGILHRDVKPGNILLAPDGRATLTDFGVARTTGDSPLTTTGLLIGSPSYIAPERARGRNSGPASDLWSLGATLYTAVEGRPPFDKGDPLPTLAAVVSDPPAACKLAGPLRPVLAGLLEKDVDRRWTVEQARAGFEATLRQDGAGQEGAGRDRAGGDGAGWRRATGAAAGASAGELNPSTLVTRPVRSRAERAGRWVLVAGAVVLALALALTAGSVIVSALRDGRAGSHPTTTGVPRLPAGFVWFKHPSGFSIAVPQGWKKETTPSGTIQFRDPAGGRFLRLAVTPAAGHDIETIWKAADTHNRGHLSGYALVGIAPAKVAGRDGADWEFTHTLQGHRHVIDRGVVVGATSYAFYLSSRENQFADSKSMIAKIADTFSITR